MLVTKSVFKFIFVLSNYQTCTFPLIPEESCCALPRKNSRPAVTIASLDWGTDWNEILMTLSCRAQSQVPVTKRIILEGHWLPKVDHRCKGSGSQSVFKTALAKLDDQKKKLCERLDMDKLHLQHLLNLSLQFVTGILLISA